MKMKEKIEITFVTKKHKKYRFKNIREEKHTICSVNIVILKKKKRVTARTKVKNVVHYTKNMKRFISLTNIQECKTDKLERLGKYSFNVHDQK